MLVDVDEYAVFIFILLSGCVYSVCTEEPQKSSRDPQLAGKCHEGVRLCWVISNLYDDSDGGGGDY